MIALATDTLPKRVELQFSVMDFSRVSISIYVSNNSNEWIKGRTKSVT